MNMAVLSGAERPTLPHFCAVPSTMRGLSANWRIGMGKFLGYHQNKNALQNKLKGIK